MYKYIHIYLHRSEEMGRRGLRFPVSSLELFVKTLFSFRNF